MGAARLIPAGISGIAVGAALWLSACAGLPGQGPDPPLAGRPHLTLACLQLDQQPLEGRPCLVVFTIANDGGWPVLLRGITPQRADDRPVSWLESWRHPLRYDAVHDELFAADSVRPGADYHRTLYRGLLLPGEAIQAYTTVVPRGRGPTLHRFRLDYLAAPWREMGPRLLIADPAGRDTGRRFRRPASPTRELAAHRLRRAFLEGRPGHLAAGSVPVALTLSEITPAPLPLPDARQLAGVGEGEPAFWSPTAHGWAFERSRRGVVVVGDDGVRRLDHVSLAALRELASTCGALTVRVIDEDMAVRLREIAADREAEEPLRLHIAPDAMPRLLAFVAARGLLLDTEPDATLPPGAGTGGVGVHLRIIR
jgi:hypothetical protein